VAKSYRQSGKIAELSLQFGGGQGALIGMGRNYGRVFTQDEAQNIVKRWRGVNSWARNIWDTFDHAIDSAVRNRGKTFNAERVKFKADAEFLWMMLPSGRLLAYPRPRIEPYLTPWGDERIGVTFQHAKGYRQHARGALLFQNATQGAAACLLRRALVEADKAGLSVIGSIHDEILCEGSPKDGKMLNKIMLEVPTWAKGLPLATGGVKTALRFGK
jgi:DNA polymerase